MGCPTEDDLLRLMEAVGGAMTASSIASAFGVNLDNETERKDMFDMLYGSSRISYQREDVGGGRMVQIWRPLPSGHHRFRVSALARVSVDAPVGCSEKFNDVLNDAETLLLMDVSKLDGDGLGDLRERAAGAILEVKHHMIQAQEKLGINPSWMLRGRSIVARLGHLTNRCETRLSKMRRTTVPYAFMRIAKDRLSSQQYDEIHTAALFVVASDQAG